MMKTLSQRLLLLIWLVLTSLVLFAQGKQPIKRTVNGVTERKAAVRDLSLYPLTPQGDAAFLAAVRAGNLTLVERTTTGKPTYFNWQPLPPTAFGSGFSDRITLTNGQVTVGIEPNIGGVISEFHKNGDRNRINTPYYGGNIANGWDAGRQVMTSYYDGPVPFQPPGYTYGGNGDGYIGWNPVMGGNVFNEHAKIYAYGRQGDWIYLKSRPLQWEVQSYTDQECYIEWWLHLNGLACEVYYHLKLDRPVNVQYEARQQEFPCAYLVPDNRFYRGYRGNSPFTGDNSFFYREAAKNEGIFAENYMFTENWIGGFTSHDLNAEGIALFSEDYARFNTARFGSDDSASDLSLDAAYINIAPFVQADYNSDIYGRFSLIAGTVSQIRSYVATKERPLQKARYDFRRVRDGWNRMKCTDTQNFSTGWDIAMNDRESNVYTANRTIDTRSVNKLYLRAAFTGISKIDLVWQRLDEPGEPDPTQRSTVAVIGDGVERTYTIELAGKPGWGAGFVGKLKLEYSYENWNRNYLNITGSQRMRLVWLDERQNP